MAVDAQEMVAFARRFDPQPFHLSDDAAGPFGGLVASGWFTASLWMRAYVDNVLGGADSRGSPGVDELRWRRPVRPGDVLTATMTVLEAHRSASHPDRGTVTIAAEMVAAGGGVVMTMRARAIFGVRPEPS
ncbi:MAG: MaoC/PaaZ C-terminal domain-containing protein [Acidimicrobiales bacterium]